jgi:hypothetical protein
MRIGRLVLVVATLVTILVFPILLRDALSALRLPNVYAAPGALDQGGRVYQNGNNGDDDNDNNNDGSGDDDDEDNSNDDSGNENVECFNNLNDNDPVPCNFNGNGNANGNFDAPVSDGNDNGAAPPPVSGFVPPSRRCFDVQEVGDIRLILSGGSITVQVVPPAGFSQITWVELDDVDPATVPAPPAGSTLLDTLVWRMDGGSPCDGPALGQLPGAVNLGIPYNVSANKSKLQIVYLRNGIWEEVPTAPDPDPANPYISATIRDTGVYAVIQKP